MYPRGIMPNVTKNLPGLVAGLSGRAIQGTSVPLTQEELTSRLEVEGVGAFGVEEGKRLVLAVEEDAGVDIARACGSYARCATYRVEFLEGEPEEMSEAELMRSRCATSSGRSGSRAKPSATATRRYGCR